MTAIHERSRATKIALKKTIEKKNDRIRQLEEELKYRSFNPDYD